MENSENSSLNVQGKKYYGCLTLFLLLLFASGMISIAAWTTMLVECLWPLFDLLPNLRTAGCLLCALGLLLCVFLVAIWLSIKLSSYRALKLIAIMVLGSVIGTTAFGMGSFEALEKTTDISHLHDSVTFHANEFDRIQKSWNCCGIFNYTDWMLVNTSTISSSCSIPVSCCKNKTKGFDLCKEGLKKAIDNCVTDRIEMFHEAVQKLINNNGCFKKIHSEAIFSKNVLNAVVGCMLLSQVSAIAVCLKVADNIKTEKKENERASGPAETTEETPTASAVRLVSMRLENREESTPATTIEKTPRSSTEYIEPLPSKTDEITHL